MNKEEGKKKSKTIKTMILKPIKGSFLSLIFTIVAILILALVVKGSGITDKSLSVLNQFIKVFGIIYAAYIGSKGIEKRAWVAGALSGHFYIIMCYLLFSLLEGKMGNFSLFLSDAMMSVVIGIIVAVLFSKISLNKRQAIAAH